MKNKKILIYIICFTLISSLIGIKLYINKNKSTKNTVAAVDTEKNKANNKQNNSKSTNEPNSVVSNPSNSSTPDINKLDITMIGTTPNTEGNTSGNLLNGGYFAKQGKWIYFTFPQANSIQHPIYRAMSDGETGLKAITNPGNFRCINVIGDWVYYISSDHSYIYRTKTDGSITDVVVDLPTFNMYIKDDFIYYITPEEVYKLKLNSTRGDKGTLLAKGQNFNYINVFDNLIYTTTFESSSTNSPNARGQITKPSLNTINLDGSNFKKLTTDYFSRFSFYNSYIFYISYNNQGLYRMNLNGSNKVQLFSYPISTFNIYNNNIYFAGEEGNQYNIYKSDLDGKKVVKLTNNIYDNQISNSTGIFFINNIFVQDDNIFYFGTSGTELNLRRTKINGSLERQLN